MNEPNERKELNNEVQEIDGSAPFRLHGSRPAGHCGTPSNTETGTLHRRSRHRGDRQRASGEKQLKGKRVRVVIGSTSTGGDPMIADMVTRHLSEERLQRQGGRLGNAQALDTISKAKGDGHHHHDVPRHGVPERTFGAVSEGLRPENLTVGPASASTPAAAWPTPTPPYNNLSEAAQWLADNPSEERG